MGHDEIWRNVKSRHSNVSKEYVHQKYGSSLATFFPPTLFSQVILEFVMRVPGRRNTEGTREQISRTTTKTKVSHVRPGSLPLLTSRRGTIRIIAVKNAQMTLLCWVSGLTPPPPPQTGSVWSVILGGPHSVKSLCSTPAGGMDERRPPAWCSPAR